MAEKKEIISASPKVRKLAREFGANIYQIQGSQREGRISEEDVKSFIKESISGKIEKKQTVTSQQYDHSEFGEIEIKSIPRIKKIAGPHLEKSWSEVPHVTQHDEVDITEMEKFRKSLRDLYTGEKLSITPLAFIIRAAVKALKDYPNFNSSLDLKKEKLIYKKYFHVGIAVDTERGLLVPVIRDVDRINIVQISSAIAELSAKARSSKLAPGEMQGGTFTISNLGGIGGSHFSPIINRPEVAILGVSRASLEPVWQETAFVPRFRLPLSLTYDHRLIDGADGIRFLCWIVEALEQPLLLALEG